MSDEIIFTITFHGPFRVGAGAAIDGFDAPIDRDDPLPASSLKGLMRAEACDRLGLPDTVVNEVFGWKGRESPWAWEDGVPADPIITPMTKIKVGPRGKVARGFVRFGEQMWANTATFVVEPRLSLDAERLARHRAVLVAAAHSVTSLGASRTRGEGWVSISADAPLDLAALIALRAEAAA